jgi:hypothetical protein
MAQNSIAKLAVQIITDTKGLVTGFGAAATETKRFARETEKSGLNLSRLGRAGADAAKSFGGIGGLGFKFGAAAGPIGITAAAVTALAVGLARAGDAGEDFRIEKLREVGELTPGLKTAAEMFGELREQLTNFAELAGFSMKPLLSDLKELARSANVLAFGEEAVAALEKQNEKARGLAEAHRQRKAAEEEAAKAAAKSAEEAKRHLDELRRRGEDLTRSLRTPDEIFKDTVVELRELAAAGHIVPETLARGMAKAGEEFRKTIEGVKTLKRELVGVPALELGTAAARTAMLSHQSGGAAAQLEKQQVELQRRIAAATEAALARPPVTFKKGTL